MTPSGVPVPCVASCSLARRPAMLDADGRLLRSAGFRFAAIYALLLAVSAAALALFLWWSTAGLLDRQTDGGDPGRRAEPVRALRRRPAAARWCSPSRTG